MAFSALILSYRHTNVYKMDIWDKEFAELLSEVKRGQERDTYDEASDDEVVFSDDDDPHSFFFFRKNDKMNDVAFPVVFNILKDL